MWASKEKLYPEPPPETLEPRRVYIPHGVRASKQPWSDHSQTAHAVGFWSKDPGAGLPAFGGHLGGSAGTLSICSL